MENAFHAVFHTFGIKQSTYALIATTLIYIMLKKGNVFALNKHHMNQMQNAYLVFSLTSGMKLLVNVFRAQRLINIVKN